jgi:chromosomal replication initiator protein
MNSYIFAGLYPKTKAKFLEDLENPPIKKIGPDRMVSIICQHFEISKEDLLRRTRKREILVPRQWLSFMLRNHSTLSSFTHIGNFMEFNHSTIISACTNVKNGILYYNEYKNHYHKLIKRIQDD